MSFSDPQKILHVKRTGDHFVDDRANGTNASAIQTDLTVLEQLQQDEQFHAHVLFSLGHKLAIDKCKFHFVTFQRSGILHHHTLSQDNPGTMSIQEMFSSIPATVRRLEPHQAHQSLGCLITIDGNQEEQFEVILKRVLDWSQRLIIFWGFTSQYYIYQKKISFTWWLV